MTQNEVKIAWEPLSKFTKELFVRIGMPPEDAEAEAGALIWANLRGIDSHGVLRIPSYVENVDKGVMNPRPNIKMVKETPATLLIDADRAFGPVVTIHAMNLVMEKAKKIGIGWGLIRNLTHQGAMGYYSQMAAKKDMVGITFVCDSPNMAPYGARVAGMHNSPIAISIPAKRHHRVETVRVGESERGHVEGLRGGDEIFEAARPAAERKAGVRVEMNEHDSIHREVNAKVAKSQRRKRARNLPAGLAGSGTGVCSRLFAFIRVHVRLLFFFAPLRLCVIFFPFLT